MPVPRDERPSRLEKGVFLPRSPSGGYPPKEVIDEADFEQWDFVAPLDRVVDIPEGRNGKRERRYPIAENGKPMVESKGWFSWLRR